MRIGHARRKVVLRTPAMQGLTDALSWSGNAATLILFAAFPDHISPSYRQPMNATQPEAIRTYVLEDPDDLLPGRRCQEYDMVFDRIPPDLEFTVTSWIEAVITAGADFGWFAFEGSFNFNNILTEDVAQQIFAVGTSQGIELALEDHFRRGPVWAARLRQTRAQLGL